MMRIRVFGALNGFTLIKFEKLSLIAEHRSGQKRILIGKVNDPQDLEKKIIKALQKEFL